MNIRIPSLDMAIKVSLACAVLFGLGALTWFLHGPDIIVNNHFDGPRSPLTDLPCVDPQHRPIAVMISSDPEARPLSGLADADMVFEMPVTPSGITRLMAVYQCGPEPTEVGSIRSARQDFIPLAQGLDAVLAHWGGEHEALAHLNSHVIDNVDALIYEGTVFYRKKNISRPHNGFSTLALIGKEAGQLGYPASASVRSYPHQSEIPRRNLGDLTDRIVIPWPQGMNVEYHYDAAGNSYARWRGGTPEIDAATGQQVSAGVVIVMETEASFIRDQYISVRTLGDGKATIYQNGQRLTGRWSKPAADDMLIFTNADGTPMPLAPGSIWVEITAPLP
jgi:hypothetical protein